MKILIIRLRLVGDVVCSTPAVRALKRHYPSARLTYLVEPVAAPVVQDNPWLDDVIVSERRHGLAGVRADLVLARRLRAQGFDLVIDFHGGPRSAGLAWMSGAPTRIGYDVTGRGWVYTRRVARPRELRPRHAVENQWDLLAPLGIPPPDRRLDGAEMPVDPGAAERVTRRLAAGGWQRGQPLIVVHVSAGNRFRRWPSESFVELVAALVRRDRQRRLLITSGPSEPAAATQVAEGARDRLGGHAGAVLDCGEVDLRELRALVERAALFVGGDSGPLHIASTSRVPIVALFGPTLAAQAAPWRDPSCVIETVEPGPLACRPCHQRHCVPGDFRCLTDTAADRVVQAAERALARASLATGPVTLGAS